MLVMPNSDAPQPWAYSIGVHRTFGHPEIMIVGLDLNEAHVVINDVVKLIQAGETIETGRDYGNLLAEGWLVTFRSVEPQWYSAFFGRAIDFYGGSDFPMLQAVWSDGEGHYPWDRGTNYAVEMGRKVANMMGEDRAQSV